MAYYQEGEKGALVPARGEVIQEAMLAIERADEETIVQHLTSDFASAFFIYSYPIKGGQVVGIGVDGSKEIARLLGNIEVLSDIKVDKDTDPDYIYAMVRARDITRNVTLLGVGRQCKYIVGENWQPTDRVDETAFVKSVNKGIRNAILSVAPQEAIAKIVQTFIEQKRLKKLPPTYGEPVVLPPKAKDKVGTEEDKLKKLRQQVGIEAGKVFKSDDERKEWQKKEYGVDSMTQLSEEQLQDMLNKVKQILTGRPIAPLTAPTAKLSPELLGFSSAAEQTKMRKDLIDLLKEMGYTSQEELLSYATERSWGKTSGVTKETLQSYIEEVKKEKGILDKASEIPEEL